MLLNFHNHPYNKFYRAYSLPSIYYEKNNNNKSVTACRYNHFALIRIFVMVNIHMSESAAHQGVCLWKSITLDMDDLL